MADLSVIIVNWNSQEYIRHCLGSLQAFCRGPAPEVLVVDNASFDGCEAMLAREFPAARFVQSGRNLGFARANNLGVRHATGGMLLFLNPDTEFIADSISVMRARLEARPDAGAVGCRLLNRDRSLQTSSVQSFPTVLNQILDSHFLHRITPRSGLWGTAALHSPGLEPAEVEALSGACIMIRRETFERVGGFSESYFMYGEDLDLCFKVRRAGWKVLHLPETSLIHFGGGSTVMAPSDFSSVMMRESVFRFIRSNRGVAAAISYRSWMTVTALARLLLIGPMMVFGDRVVRHGAGSWQKWFAILRWGLGLAQITRV